VYLSAFLEATLRARHEYLPLFRDHRVIGGWLPKTMYITRFMDHRFRSLARFDEDVEVSTGTAAGITITAESLGTWREGVLPLRSRNPNTGTSGVWIGWNNRIGGPDTTVSGKPASYSVSLGDSIRLAWAVGAETALEFSLAPVTGMPEPRLAPRDTTKQAPGVPGTRPSRTPAPPKHVPTLADSLPIELSLEVVDANGVSAKLRLSRYGVARRPVDVTVLKRKGRDKAVFASLAELVPQTFVIPLADFRAATPSFDPGKLTTIRWVFDGTRAGTVVLTDIGLSNIDPAFWTRGAR
jgi:hypothetical protein